MTQTILLMLIYAHHFSGNKTFYQNKLSLRNFCLSAAPPLWQVSVGRGAGCAPRMGHAQPPLHTEGGGG